MKRPEKQPRTLSGLLLACLLLACLFLSGCGDLVQMTSMLLETRQSSSLPSAAADAQAPSLTSVNATAASPEAGSSGFPPCKALQCRTA